MQPDVSLALLLKYARQASREPLATALALGEGYPYGARLRLGRRQFFLITSPAGVKHVLQDNQHNYLRFAHSQHHVRPLLGDGLLSADGENWRRQRRIMQQAFKERQIKALARPMAETIENYIAEWPAEGEIDLGIEMTRLTLAIVTRTLFGSDNNPNAETVRQAYLTVMHTLVGRMVNPFARLQPSYRQALDSLHQAVDQLVTQSQPHPANPQNLLALLKAAHDQQHTLSDSELHDQALTMLLAGHETCANALTWAIYLLAWRPQIQAQAAAEADQVVGSRQPGPDDLPRLVYLQQIFHEALRLYPPAWIMARDSQGADEIEGIQIPPGGTIFLSPYVTHRLPNLWDDPEKFDPQRFTANALVGRPRFAYFPFGGGQRQCLGKEFALTESLLMLAMILRRYRLSVVERERERGMIQPDVGMHPRRPVYLKIESRDE